MVRLINPVTGDEAIQIVAALSAGVAAEKVAATFHTTATAKPSAPVMRAALLRKLGRHLSPASIVGGRRNLSSLPSQRLRSST